MIISHDLKYMFIHLPKTGGTSIKILFENNPKDFKPNLIGKEKLKTKNLYPHSSLNDGIQYLKNSRYQSDEYFKFVFIRNPWDRMVSAYEYHVQVLAKRNLSIQFKSFEQFIYRQTCIKTYHADIVNENFVNTNYKFDFIGKFENIKEDMQTICKKIMKNNYRHINLPHANATSRHNYRNYYNNETQEMVAKTFAKIIELGNYSF